MARLDDAYACMPYIDGGADYPDRWAEDARQFREAEVFAGRARLNVPYGTKHDRQALDLFLPSGRPKGLLVFVHGGYWHRFHRTDWSHFASGALAQEWAVAMPSYVLAPEASIPEIGRHVAQGIELAAQMVPGEIVLTGHSAGGQLVARMAMGDLVSGDVAGRISRIMPISPVADLGPMTETSMNEMLKITDGVAASESPTLNAKALDVPCHVWVGGAERPVFVEQAKALAQAWHTELTIEPARHHFDVIDDLQDPDSAMMRWLTGA